jgi:tetratricopeptide (TPR) repeat protein
MTHGRSPDESGSHDADAARPNTDALVRRAMRAPPRSIDYVDALLALGDALLVDDPALAERTLREACAVASTLCDGQRLAQALAQHAWLLMRSGAPGKALLEAEHARALCLDIPASAPATSAVFVLAMVRGAVGDLATAGVLWRELLELAQHTDNNELTIRCRLQFGAQLARAGRLDDAQEQFSEAHARCVAIAHPDLAGAANNLAMLHNTAGRFEQARLWAQDALQRCPPDARLWRANYQHTLGRALLGLRDIDQAEDALAQARAGLRSAHEDMQLAILIEIDQALVAARRGRVPDALDGLHRAQTLAVEARMPDLEAEAHAELQSLYRSIGALESALEHCNQRSVALQRISEHGSAASSAVLCALDQAAKLKPRWIADPFAITYISDHA